VKATWGVMLSTGYDLTDNDLHRVRERIEEILAPLAEEYFANLEVRQGYFIPGPRILPPDYAGQEP
jgi:hypothetical protein